MALPGLHLPPYIVFRENAPRMLFSCSELVVCSRLSLTHTHSGVHTSCRWQGVLAAEPAPWWGVDTGPCRPPWRPPKLPVLRTGPGGPFPAWHWGCSTGEGHGFLAHKDHDALEPAGLRSSRVPLGWAPGLREAVYPASLIAVRGPFRGAPVSSGWASRFLAGFASQT